jgi:hypothetical protein
VAGKLTGHFVALQVPKPCPLVLVKADSRQGKELGSEGVKVMGMGLFEYAARERGLECMLYMDQILIATCWAAHEARGEVCDVCTK